MITLTLIVFYILGGLGLTSIALALIFFRTKPYKPEFVLFGGSGLSLMFISGVVIGVLEFFKP